ncbi:RagB/SusD family nutrient uptake outer membrane protein [Niabella ginsengisoli]|uniref:RagB/SusD family nutrient uptake outer membrane protein n=1 Tax=Niabella ginsengisoli TaxID=522298 RepID=A0ABS9SFM4_9BACT|nr:RagB/SusD family nutrient uptake outer membrane protein [Niabella ginsengisoli]MCH5597149.1 RagB/SusD family nutrient uptake outer membrane protein [Niabella ginsengisoli]
MRNKHKLFRGYITYMCICFFVMLFTTKCTKLDEVTYTDLQFEDFYKNKRDVLASALRPLTHMQAWLAPTGGSGYYYHSELSADQQAWPQKGRHGYDAGDHIRQHYHTWTADETRIRDAWSLIFTGLGYTNAALGDITKLDSTSVGMTQGEMDSVITELKVLRAFHYLKAMDMWGNIPISEEIASSGSVDLPATSPRTEVFEYVKSQLEENVPKLPKYNDNLIGRISQTAGYAMLAELYLNAQKWNGTPMWDECIVACDKIISGEAGGLPNGGTPQLNTDINAAFSNTNQRNSEALFQVAYSRKGGFAFDWGGFYFGYDYMKEVLKVNYGGWNAFVTIPTAFDAFAENDLRKKDWFLFGPQYKYGTTTPVLGTEEYNGKPLVFVNSIRRESEGDKTSEGSMIKGEENSGARFNKYKSGTLDDANYQENHYMIYRLTEIYFNKAEALMRKNGAATTEAVTLINDCRKRAFTDADWSAAMYTTSSLTLDELLKERGREFIFEGKRREDLIRFGKFTTATWWDHQPTNDPNKELFPIPNTQLEQTLNSNKIRVTINY